MRLRNRQDGAGDGAAPHRVFWNACVLADDIAHRGISGTAEGVERRCGIGKKALAISSFAAGTAVAVASLRSEPAIAMTAAAAGGFAIPLMGTIISRAMRAADSISSIAINMEGAFLRITRLPALLYGLWDYIGSGESHHAAAGALFTGYAVAAYLATGGNGMIERISSVAQEALGALRPEPSRVPIKIDK